MSTTCLIKWWCVLMSPLAVNQCVMEETCQQATFTARPRKLWFVVILRVIWCNLCMNIITSIVVAIGLITCFGCTSAKKQPTEPDRSMKVPMNASIKGNSSYSINNSQVSKEVYVAFVGQLLPEQHDWSCDESSDGGAVTYILKDKQGNEYFVEEESKGGTTVYSIMSRKN